MKIIHAEQPDEIEKIGCLFREYEKFLAVDLCFQDFEEELADLPGKYNAPDGALLMAVDGKEAAGCVALRKLSDDVCEMKRLFIRPKYRGRKLGKMLAEKIIEEAVKRGYSLMYLDTLEKLQEAIQLYKSLGFKETNSYYHNPLPGVLYWKLDLRKKEKS